MKFHTLVDLIDEHDKKLVEESFKSDLWKKIALLTVAGLGWNYLSDLNNKVAKIQSQPSYFEYIQKEVRKRMQDKNFQNEVWKQFKEKIEKNIPKPDESLLTTPLKKDAVVEPDRSPVYQEVDNHKLFMSKAVHYISNNELIGGKIDNKPYKDNKGLWTIGIGHLIVPKDYKDGTFKEEDFVKTENGEKVLFLTDKRAMEVLEGDLSEKLVSIRRQFLGFDNYPESLKIVILDGFFRGDIAGSPRTKALIRSAMEAHFKGKHRVARALLKSASKEYLSSKEYKTYSNPKAKGGGIVKRMRKNAFEIENALNPKHKPDFQKSSYL